MTNDTRSWPKLTMDPLLGMIAFLVEEFFQLVLTCGV